MSLYKAVFEQSDDAVFILEGNSVIECNSAFERLMGKPRDALLGQSADMLFEQCDSCRHCQTPALTHKIAEVLDSGKAASAQYTLYHYARQESAEYHIALKPFEQEGERSLIVFMNSMAPCKLMYERNLENMHTLQNVIDHIEGIALFIKTQDEKYAFSNRYHTENITGSDTAGHLSAAFHSKEDAELMHTVDRQVLDQGQTFTYEEEIRHLDGSLHRYRTTKIPLKDTGGTITSLLGICVDITAQIEIERQLRELNQELERNVQERTQSLETAFETLKKNEQRYRVIFETSSEGIWIIDQERKTIEVNSALAQMLGYTAEEMLGKTPMEFADAKNRLIFKAQTDKIESSDERSYEISLTHKNGSQIPTILHANTVRDNSGQVIMACAFVTNISQRKQAEEKMKQYQEELLQLNSSLQEKIEAALNEQASQQLFILRQQRMATMGEMLAMIAHQWRQPLASISATVATLQIRLQLHTLDQAETYKQLENIAHYSQHLSKTIDDFRNFFKEEREAKLLDFTHVIENACSIIEGSLKTNNITLEKVLSPGIVVTSYGNELQQVILNLLKNSEDAFMEREMKGGKIILQSTQDEHYVSLTVSDNAGGIAETIMENIFDPYFTTKDDINGTGLGLYMSKIIIDKHCKGSLKAENSADGVRFTIMLPKGRL